MQLAFANVRTRTYSTSEGHAMIPGADLLNTAPGDSLNSEWDVSKSVFSIKVPTAVTARTEVYDVYCAACNNYRMLSIWGVYMEDNVNLVSDGSFRFRKLKCSAWTWGRRHKLRTLVEDSLDISEQGLALVSSQNLTAPRCRHQALAVPQKDQGPLRCSLARLTWEYCANSWGYPSREPASNPPAPRADHAREAMLIDQSARHGVHAELLAKGTQYSSLLRQRRVQTSGRQVS